MRRSSLLARFGGRFARGRRRSRSIGTVRAADPGGRRNWRRWTCRAGRYRLTGPDALQPLAYDELSLFEAVGYNRSRRRRLPKLYTTDLGLVLRIQYVDVISLLVGQHRGTRDGQNRDRLHPFKAHGHEFAVDQLPRTRLPGRGAEKYRVGDDATEGERVRGFGHGGGDVVELGVVPVSRAVRVAAV